jgi:neutral ceramidase
MPREQACHGAKVLLLPTGFLGRKSWTANEAPFQLLRFGSLVVAGLPFEVTTMAGRRIERELLQALSNFGVTKVVLSSLANEYLHYLTTKEEYGSQQYEGGATLFGPNSLEVYQILYHRLARGLVEKVRSPDLRISNHSDQNRKLSEIKGIEVPSPLFSRPDRAIPGFEFGSVLNNGLKTLQRGQFQEVQWVGGSWVHHDPAQINQTGTVEELRNGVWYERYGLESPSTTMEALTKAGGVTVMKMTWKAENTGTFKLCYRGRARLSEGIFKAFSSCSATFEVKP